MGDGEAVDGKGGGWFNADAGGQRMIRRDGVTLSRSLQFLARKKKFQALTTIR